MRTLLLLRHAKSSWADPTLPDHDRPLAARGVRAAKQIAGHVRSLGVRPGLVLCSSARRARETLEALEPAWGGQVEVQFDDDLYRADAAELLDRLRRVDAQTVSALVVGHNPTMQDLAIELAGDGDEAAMAQLHTKFPTAALATLDISRIHWDELAPGQAYLSSLVLPRQLG